MRVLIVSKSFIEAEKRKNILALAPHVEVRVITPASLAGAQRPPGEYSLDSTEFARSHYDAIRALRPFGREYVLKSITLGMKGFRPDVIHIDHEPWSLQCLQTLSARSVWAPSARLVCTIKKNTYRRYPGLRGYLKRQLGCVTMKTMAHFLASSQMTARLYQRLFGIGENRITLAPQWGVDTDVFRPRPRVPPRSDRSPVVGYVGRLVPEKGVEDLVSAVDTCRSDGRADVQLRIVGDGSLRHHLEGLAAQRPWLTVDPALPNREVADFLRAVDVFVMPTRVLPDHQEHDGQAILEALSSGVPTIGTRSGVIPELLEGGAGLTVEADCPTALAGAIGDLAVDLEKGRRLALAGRQRVEEAFTLEKIAQRKIDVYRKVLSESTS